MGQPVKLSNPLIRDARLVGAAAERSIAGQIEFWARLGRALEGILRGDEALRLKALGEAHPLSALLDSVDSEEGRTRLYAHLASRPFPHFEAGKRAGWVVKIDRSGRRTSGRFRHGKFVAARARS